VLPAPWVTRPIEVPRLQPRCKAWGEEEIYRCGGTCDSQLLVPPAVAVCNGSTESIAPPSDAEKGWKGHGAICNLARVSLRVGALAVAASACLLRAAELAWWSGPQAEAFA